jgi:AAA family ATP:ADP antiporter
MPRRAIDRIVTIRDGEAATAMLMFTYSFLAMTSYNILKPITRSQFISALGADNLPYVQFGAGLLIGVLMQWYSKGAALLPRRWVIPTTLGVEALVLTLFWLLFQTGAGWVSVAFYVLALILGILLTSQFWTLASDIYDARQAKRLFGLIGGGASLGGATGAGLTSLIVAEVGTTDLLLVSAALLGVCACLVTAIVQRERVSTNASALDERGVGGGEAIRLLRSSRHLQMIAILIGCAAIGAAIIEQQLNMAAEALAGGSTDVMTAFLAQITFYLSLAGFFVQIVLTSRIHRSLGLAVALLILPVTLGATGALILATGALWAVGAARVLDTSLRYTIDKTTREVLFLPLPPDLKYRAKPFVDVTIDRSAKALGALVALVLIKPWGFHIGWRGLSGATLVMAIVWIAMALRARAEYLKAVRRSIQTQTMPRTQLQLDGADAATIELLVEELSERDPSRVLYAIDMLEMLGKSNLITPLLLHHESGAVRARVLAALESTPFSTDRWVPTIRRLLNDRTASVRAAALHALATLHKEHAASLVRRHLSDPEPRIAVAAAAILAESDADGDAAVGEAALATNVEEGSPATRLEVATALAHVRNTRCRALLAALIHDPEIDVARAAIRSAHMLAPADIMLVPALVARLADRPVKAVAREALVGYGDHACGVLSHVLGDPDEPPWVRRHVPGTLARIPTQPSMDTLVRALGDRDGFLRFKVLAAIERLHRCHGDLVVDKTIVEQRLLDEAHRYQAVLTLRHNLRPHEAGADRSVLTRALDDKLQRILDRIFRLIGLVYPWKEIDAARRGLARGDKRSAASAVEYLDNVLSHSLRKQLMPILEDQTVEERVRSVNKLLRTRPRDVEDTIAQLVHDDDQVISAAAIQFVQTHRLWSLVHDLEYAQAHDSTDDRLVQDAASWALQLRLHARTAASAGRFPLIEVVDRLARIRMFQLVSVDELCRIASAGRQIAYTREGELFGEPGSVDQVVFLLDGKARIGAGPALREMHAPTTVAFSEPLERRQLRETVVLAEGAVCLALGADDFFAMLSDNVLLARGLFRTLLDSADPHGVPVHRAARAAADGHRRTGILKPLEKLFVLERNPLFAGATVSQLLDIASIAREVALERDTPLFDEQDAAAVYYVVSGELRLGSEDLGWFDAGPGATVGMSAALADLPVGWRASVSRDGQALTIDREDLINLLAEDVELLRCVTTAVLHTTRLRPVQKPRAIHDLRSA